MLTQNRRAFLGTATAGVAVALMSRLLWADEKAKSGPLERPNVLYGLSTGSWGRVVKGGEPLPLLKILDETAAAGFNGVRLTGFPNILQRNQLSVEQYGDELAKRGLRFSTVSFGGEYFNREKQPEIRERARCALDAHKRCGAGAMVVFPPSPVPAAQEAEALRDMFRFMGELGKMALDEYGIRMGLHNHTDSLIENPQQVTRFLEGTDPRYVFCAWDSAHLLLGGCDVQAVYRGSIDRIVYTDFKDATLSPVTDDYRSPNGERFAGDSKQGKFFNSMLELGRGQIDFVSLMKMLAAQQYRGWINHDLDTIRISTAESWRVAMNYVREKLDPVYQ
jgi:sugar phosphate isomerase/epimerase